MDTEKSSKDFPVDYFKVEVVQLRAMNERLKNQRKNVKQLMHFYRRKRNSVKELKKLNFDLEGIGWLEFINNHVLDFLEEEIKKRDESKGSGGGGPKEVRAGSVAGKGPEASG